MTPPAALPRRRFFPVLAATVATVVLVGCASSGGSERSPRGTQNRIIRAELAQLDQLNALQAIERLRPRWLRGVLGRSPVPVIDGTPQRQMGLDVLRSMRAADVQEMRFMSASDATTRWGTGYDGGAIVVQTLRGSG